YPALEVAQAELGPRQVAHDPDLAPSLLADLSDAPNVLGLVLRRPVGEVEPEDVDPGLEQLTEHLGLPARRAERGDDLGATGGGHQLWPEGRVRGMVAGAGVSGAVTGPVGASSGGGGRSSSCSITRGRQTTPARTSPAAAESSATKTWPPPIWVRSKKSRTGGTVRASTSSAPSPAHSARIEFWIAV